MYSRFLMAPPGPDFQPHFLGNPWMTYRQVSNPDRARRQWETLVALLKALGAEIMLLSERSDSSMMTFTADGALVHAPGEALVLRNESERGDVEPAYFRDWLQAQGFRLDELPPELRLDGGNLVAAAPGVWLVGMKSGQTGAAERYLGSFLQERGIQLIQIPLVDRRFGHLDLAFANLGGRAYLIFPAAFADRGAFVRDAVWRCGRPIIEVTAEDAHAFGCNAVVLSKTLVTGLVSRELRRAIAACGYHVECVELGEFHYAGGGVKCVTLPLDPPAWDETRNGRGSGRSTPPGC